jgi:hypothetical protein
MCGAKPRCLQVLQALQEPVLAPESPAQALTTSLFAGLCLLGQGGRTALNRAVVGWMLFPLALPLLFPVRRGEKRPDPSGRSCPPLFPRSQG